MQGTTRQSNVAPFPVPDVRIDARQSSERDLHWRSPTRRRHAARRRKLSGVPPAVVSGQHDGVGPPLHIKTDSRLWLLIGIGGRLTAPPLPHHRAYGSRTTAVRS